MTIYGLVASLGWLVFASYCVSRIPGLVRLTIAHREKMAEKALVRWQTESDGKKFRNKLKWDAKLAIAQAAQPVVPRGTSSKDIKLPDDLEAYVMSWGDEFARDDERGAIRARYLELHTGDPAETWQRVRRATGIGEMPI